MTSATYDTYTHYKGGLYRYHQEFTCEGDGSIWVLYQSVATLQFFGRPKTEWLEKFKPYCTYCQTDEHAQLTDCMRED